MALFRQRVTTYFTPDGKRCPASEALAAGPDGKKVLRAGYRKEATKSKKWYGQYTDADGVVRRVPLSENKTAAQQMLNDLVRKAELGKAGIRDRFEDHRRRPLTAHLGDWEASLRANGRGDDYVKLKLARVRAALDGCKAVFTADLAADRLELFLAGLRSGEAGLSIQTSNDYLQAVKQFTRWLVDNDRLDRSPFARLRGGNVKLDRRHDRRDLPPAELQKILDVTRRSEKKFRGLSGEDRYHLYLTACGTGFRSSELAALMSASFALDAEPPTATLPAEATKNKKPVTQPLPPDVATALRGFLAGRPTAEPVWPGTWSDRSADMLKGDLEAAGIPYSVEGPHGPLFADFHALRHSFITSMERAGISPKTAQELARHSDIRLTLQRYTHKTLHDLGSAVERLPSIVPTGGGAGEAEALPATGTDGAEGQERPAVAYTKLTREADSERDQEMADETAEGRSVAKESLADVPRVFELRPDETERELMRAERAGFEPAVGFDTHAALAKRGRENANTDHEITSGIDTPPLTIPLTTSSQIDPDLARVVAAWDTLPEEIRKAVLGIISNGTNSGQ